MSEEMKMLLNLTKEVAEYKTFFSMLTTKVDVADEKDRHYIDVDEIKPLMAAFKKNREVDVITFDNCPDTAYRV